MKKKHDLLYILSVFVVVLLCWYVSKYHYQLMLVDGQSMEPTFRDKSLVLLDKHASERRTGDVVYCRCESVGRYIVKRIAAVPGTKDYGALTVAVNFTAETLSNFTAKVTLSSLPLAMLPLVAVASWLPSPSVSVTL